MKRRSLDWAWKLLTAQQVLDLSQQVRFLPTGIRIFDEVLGGGLPRGQVTALFGRAGVGVSTLLTQVCRNVARRAGTPPDEVRMIVNTDLKDAVMRRAWLLDAYPRWERNRFSFQGLGSVPWAIYPSLTLLCIDTDAVSDSCLVSLQSYAERTGCAVLMTGLSRMAHYSVSVAVELGRPNEASLRRWLECKRNRYSRPYGRASIHLHADSGFQEI